MPDWKAALPQIIASIVGSSLVVTLVGALISEINSPHIEIAFRYDSSDKETNFDITFTNVGVSEANHVRLTMSYPGASITNPSISYANENTTLEYENGSSLVYFVPRLTSGARVIIDLTIDKPVNNLDNFAIPNKYSTKRESFAEPYSITATYDEGSDTYVPYSISLIVFSRYNPQMLVIPLILIFAFISFAVAFRYKRKSGAKFASEILKNILTVIYGLNKEPSKVFFYSIWDKTNTENKRRIFNNYEDYKKIDNFFDKLKHREHFILQSQEVMPILKEFNKECIEQASKTYMDIRWKKFFELDYFLGIPLIILGSFFITLVCTGIPFLYTQNTGEETVNFSFVFFRVSVPFIIISTITRTVAGFFITILVLRVTNNISIDNNALPKLSPFFTILLSIIVVGVPSYLITEPILDLINFISEKQLEKYVTDFLSLSAINYLSDSFRLLLLIVLISRYYSKRIDKLKINVKKVYDTLIFLYAHFWVAILRIKHDMNYYIM